MNERFEPKEVKKDFNEINKNGKENLARDIIKQNLNKIKSDLDQYKESILAEDKIKKINFIDQKSFDAEKKIKNKEKNTEAQTQDSIEKQILVVENLLKDKPDLKDYIVSVSEYKKALTNPEAKKNLIKKIDSFFDISYRLHGQGSFGRLSPRRYFGLFSQITNRSKEDQEFDIIHDTYVDLVYDL